MASDSGHTLYTAADTLSKARGLSASISSLSSPAHTGRNAAAAHISKTYRQASTLFLTRRLPEALSTVLPLVTPPASDDPNGPFEPAPVAKASRSSKVKVWSLYLTVLNAIVELDSDEGKEAFGTQEWRALCHKVREGEVWEEVVRNGYHGVEGDVDAEVVINLATILLAHAKNQILNQKRLENYLAAARSPNLDLSDRFSESTPRRYSSPAAGKQRPRGGPSGADTPRDLNARVKILELYTLHVLPRNSEWDYAREFISVSPVLDEERREAFLQALDSLREEQLAAERHEEEERLKREEAIRRDIEEARRLRAENEAREKRRLEEERLKREREAAESSAAKATEGDFGLDERAATPPTTRSKPKPPGSQSSAGSSSMSRPRGPAPGRGARGSGNAVAAPTPTLLSRAAVVLDNLRLLVDEVAGAFKTNPYVLLRMLAFVIGLLMLLSRKRFRERIARVLGLSWGKIKATAGMGTKVDDLGTPIPVLLEACALKAVEGVRDALATADHALVLVVAEAALVTYPDERRRPHVRVAYGALAVALVAEPPDGNARLFAAHHKEPEDHVTNKRKASPESNSEDGAGKRVRLGDGDENAPRLNTVDSELKEGQTKDVPLVEEEQAGPGSTMSPTRADPREPEPEPPRSPEARRPSAPSGPPIRRNVSLEEKKRGQRLFGSLVSTISRTTSRPQQQKRLEIERRQQEKAQQRRAEDEKRRAERLEQLKKTRQIEQIKLDEQVMETRHSTMLAMAQSLQTKSEPKLYYVPWQLSREQEDIVNDQIRATRDIIEKEVREFKTRKEQRFKALGVSPPPRSPSPPPPRQEEQLPEPEPDAKPRSKEATIGEPELPPQDTNADTVAATPSKARTDHEKEHDENGDEMMQDEEDIIRLPRALEHSLPPTTLFPTLAFSGPSSLQGGKNKPTPNQFFSLASTMASSEVDKLTPTDPRVQHHTYTIPASKRTYHYLLAEPSTGAPAAATVLLVHGFPDLAFGWRYQVPHLLSLNLRVIVPDMVGYGRTDAPQELAAYSFKSAVDDLVALVSHVQGKGADEQPEKFVLGGHDWGGVVVWRFALWYPELLRCVFSVCTPFFPVGDVYVPTAEMVKRMPSFGYQLQWEGTEVDKAVVGREKLRGFFNMLWGAPRKDGERIFDAAHGLYLDKFEADQIGESPLVSKEELDHYLDEYADHGLQGGLRWYKTRKINFEEERVLLEKGKTTVTLPSLMVVALRDIALLPSYAVGMEKYVPNLVKKEVDSSHWALWEKPAEVNQYIEEFLKGVLKGQPLKASI
ncbi:uncharacterized protein B0T15DRAFT_487392 [Chaetomium strumarium]|uniref:AB hydrolase-1 domain-containing protein n=1 Tax=Chaetomium strumarium TaxID=1170767 RepID=A0AAJ0GLL8_9PEZI|nr:hypothetical protein B0T15DRAFT_487392 [Chaetomium strumarium]